MIFNKDYIRHLQGEIEHLRNQNAELLDRLMAMSNDQALQSFKLMENPQMQAEYVDPHGRLASMEALTEEEQEQKKLAETQIKQMFR